MKKKVLEIAIASMLVAMLASPVFAIGPWQGAEVSGNDNFFVLFGGLGNNRAAAGGSNVWALSNTGEYWVEWKWRDPLEAKGLVNNALVPTTLIELGAYVTAEYDNKWIFLSGDAAGQPNQVMGHGMVYWLFYYAFGSSTAAGLAAASLPNGALWMHNSIYSNIP
jgi:hypothetical protein